MQNALRPDSRASEFLQRRHMKAERSISDPYSPDKRNVRSRMPVSGNRLTFWVGALSVSARGLELEQVQGAGLRMGLSRGVRSAMSPRRRRGEPSCRSWELPTQGKGSTITTPATARTSALHAHCLAEAFHALGAMLAFRFPHHSSSFRRAPIGRLGGAPHSE